MTLIRDTTGRFSCRPYYEQTYLDENCERLIFDFPNELYGQITLPMHTGACRS